MCSPKVYLKDYQIKRRKYWKNVLLNDTEKIYQENLIKNRKPNFLKLKETEYVYVAMGIHNGMQTYCAQIPGTDFRKFGANCKKLAAEVDRFLVYKLKKPAVNGFIKPLKK